MEGSTGNRGIILFGPICNIYVVEISVIQRKVHITIRGDHLILRGWHFGQDRMFIFINFPIRKFIFKCFTARLLIFIIMHSRIGARIFFLGSRGQNIYFQIFPGQVIYLQKQLVIPYRYLANHLPYIT